VALSAGAILELEVRAYQPPSGWYGYPEDLFLPDEHLGYKYKPNFNGFFPRRPYDHIAIAINERGLRDRPHEYLKPAGVTRILGLGDSVTFGAGVSFEDIYLRRLETRFKRAHRSIEIINAGVNSYEFDQERNYFLIEGYRYQPDIVLIGLVLNDITPMTPDTIRALDAYHRGLKASSGPRIPTRLERLETFCRSCGFIYRTLHAGQTSEEFQRANLKYYLAVEQRWRTEWPAFKQRLIDFLQELRRRNIKPMIVVFPFTEQFSHYLNRGRFPQIWLSDLCAESGVPMLDVLPLLDRPDYQRYFLGDDHLHFTANGHNLVASAVYDWIMKTGVLNNDH
jgi:lysophospholipase L1-like esterase